MQTADHAFGYEGLLPLKNGLTARLQALSAKFALASCQ